MEINEGDVKGWIAIYNRKKIEILKGKDAKDLYTAKVYALSKLKVPKSKVGLLAIQPAYDESFENIGDVITEEIMEENENVASVQNVIKYAQDSNPTKMKSEVGAIIGSRIMDRIESKREEIARGMFSK